MPSRSWWQQLFQKIPHSPARRKKAGDSTRLMEVEQLENRLVPANILVHNTADGAINFALIGGDTAANLRSAVAIANSRTDATSIILDSTKTYQLTNASPYGGELLIHRVNSTLLTIKSNDPTSSATITSTNHDLRLFEIYGGSVVTMDHLKLTNGLADQNAPTDGSAGGAILNHGNLTLTNDFISSNEARGYGGAPFQRLTLQPQLQLINSVPLAGEGGGIYNDVGATLKIDTSTIDHNTAYGGDVNVGFHKTGNGTDAAGGGLYIENSSKGPTDKVDITASTFSCNRAVGGAFTGAEGSQGSAGNAFGGSIAEGTPAAKHTLNIYNSTFDHNTAQGGNASKNVNSYGYTANQFSVSGGSAFGGALQVDSLVATSVNNIVNSTFAYNKAIGGNATNTTSNGYGTGTSFTGGDAYGGAIHVDYNNIQPINLVNDTIALNSVSYGSGSNAYGFFAPGSAGGGGVDTSTGIPVKKITPLVKINPFQSELPPGGVTVLNTIIANNTSNGDAPDVSGSFKSNGHNFIGDWSGSTGFSAASFDQFGDPGLDTTAGLQYNGGPTKTINLTANSKAIDAGDDKVVTSANPTGSPITTDQRGLPRLSGNHVDIGAVEVQKPKPKKSRFSSDAHH